MSFTDRTNCPLHMSEPCPPGCDYWTKSDAMDAKAAARVCCCFGCERAADVGDVCAPCADRIAAHLKANPPTWTPLPATTFVVPRRIV